MVKRIGSIASLLLIVVMMTASYCFAAPQGLVLEKQYPDDGATGTAVENISVKLWFNQNVRPKSDAIRKANKKAIKLRDSKGKEVPIYVAYNPEEEGQVMILSGHNVKIQDSMKYTLTIDGAFQATSGATLMKADKVTFETLDQARNMTINMVMMGVMVVGMIFFTVRSTKRQVEKEKGEKGKVDTVNPYKEAKRTGKSVEEIVAKDKKNKEKRAASAGKKLAKGGEEEPEEQDSNRKRVAGPRPISAAGSTYKAPKRKKPTPKGKQGTTRPKNQTGRQKNRNKKK